MARILISAQQSELFDFVGHALAQEGHFVRFLHDLRDAPSRVSALMPDLIIVDAAISLAAAEEVCVRIRKTYTVAGIRILILRRASDGVNDAARPLRADAYLARPLHPRAFLARVHTLLSDGPISKPKAQIVVGDVVINLHSFRVTRSGRLLSLTLKEFRLLHHLASHPDVVCSREYLLDVVWENRAVTPQTVDATVRRLRKKLEENPKRPHLIHTVLGHGYFLSCSSRSAFKVICHDGDRLEHDGTQQQAP